MQKLCCFIVFLCQYINSFALPEISEGGYSPPSHPLNPPLDSYIYWFLILFKFQNKDDMRADEFHHCVIHLKYLLNSLYVTIFGKIDHLRASTEINFLPVRESYIHALSRNTKCLTIDGQVCFYRRPFADAVEP